MSLTIPPPIPSPFPPPHPEPRVPLPLPTVYVAPVWEYKHLHRVIRGDAPPVTENELNALGADGWELAGMIPSLTGVHLYFKRAPA